MARIIYYFAARSARSGRRRSHGNRARKTPEPISLIRIRNQHPMAPMLGR